MSQGDVHISGWEWTFHCDTHILNMETCSGLTMADGIDWSVALETQNRQQIEESLYTNSTKHTTHTYDNYIPHCNSFCCSQFDSCIKLCWNGSKRQDHIYLSFTFWPFYTPGLLLILSHESSLSQNNFVTHEPWQTLSPKDRPPKRATPLLISGNARRTKSSSGCSRYDSYLPGGWQVMLLKSQEFNTEK